MHDLKPILEAHPFFHGLKEEYLDFITGCASNVRFKEGDILLKEGDDSDHFFLVREGKVAVEIGIPQHDSITIQTIQDGEIVGWSWLVPPHKNRFSCRAITEARVISLDGKCLRNKCENNHDLGYELLKRLAIIFTERLEVTRKQLIDIYSVEHK
jgi:CRP-like cAMP-binding protein